MISWRLAPVLALAVFGAVMILIPLFATGWISFTSGAPGQGQYTLQNYATVISDPFGYRVLTNTLALAFGSTLLAVLIGAPLAWAVARSDLPWKHLISLMMGMVLVVPGFIQGIGWAILLSPTIGIVNRLLIDALGLAQAPLNIYTLGGMIFVQGLELVPPAFFILLPVLMAMDASFEEAGYLSGASKIRTFLRVNMPLAFPAIVASAIYVFVLASTLFEVPAVLGFPNRIFVFSTMIFLYISPQGDLPRYGLAAAYGSIIVVFSLLMAAQYARVISKGRKYVTITGKGRRAGLVRLGSWRRLAVGLVLLYFALAIGLPVATLVYYSLLPFFQMPSLQAFQSFTLENYVDLVDRTGVTPFLNTGLLVAIVPLSVVLIAIPISWIVVRSRVPGRSILDNIAFLPVAVPRIVIAVAILYLALLGRQFIPIYGTIFIIVVAHVIIFMSFATRILNGAMIQIHPDLEEAGRVSGAPLTRVLFRVTMPLVRPALFFAWFWVMLLSFREVTVAILLSSPRNLVLPTLIWTQWHSAQPHQAAAAAVVMVLIAFAMLLALRRRIEQVATNA